MFDRPTSASLARHRRTSAPIWPLPALNGRAPIFLPHDPDAISVDLAYRVAMPPFVPVFAVADGVVAHAGPQRHGYALVLDHRNGWATSYANLEHVFVRPTVAASRPRRERVMGGDVLGYVGAPTTEAPRSLHFQLWKRGADGEFEPVPAYEHMQSWLLLPWSDERNNPTRFQREL